MTLSQMSRSNIQISGCVAYSAYYSYSFGRMVFIFDTRFSEMIIKLLCTFQFCNHLEEKEKAGCFASIVLQMYCY